MLPKIAIVGRPNVGKSALFNRICQKRISIVDEEEGITRDRLYAKAELFGSPFILIDTGGIDLSGKILFAEEVKNQAENAIAEADVIVFVVDGRVGLTALDEELAKRLRRGKKPVVVAVNKIDGEQDVVQVNQFYRLGFPRIFGVSALQGQQIAEMLEAALACIAAEEESVTFENAKEKSDVEEESVTFRSAEEKEEESVTFRSAEEEANFSDAESVTFENAEEKRAFSSGPIRVAIVGRPNVGKSTLLNQLLCEQRSIVSPIAGTTRDAIDALLTVERQDYLLIDTAGIRRKKAEKEVVDKFAAIRTEEALERAEVCLLVLDSFEGFTVQERRIASRIEEMGKSCIILFNKWDLVSNLRMEHALRGVREAVPFLAHCPTLFLSATTGRNLEKILPVVKEVHEQRGRRITTGELNKLIERSIQKYHPPLITGKRLRIYYLAQVEVNPPKFVLFVNKPDLLTESYRKYLVNQLRKAFPFSGTPLMFELRGKGTDPI